MSEGFLYAILGRGRWAGVVTRILHEEGRRVVNLGNVRNEKTESESEYRSRICHELMRSGARIAWLCIPPVPHLPVMIEAALSAGIHVIAEKPWLCPRSESDRLSFLAREKRLQVGFDWEYCLINEIEGWRRHLDGGAEMLFSGCFSVSRPDRLGISALDNLGSHLAAIHAYAVPKASISELSCDYDSADRRLVCLESGGQIAKSVDFHGNREPLIQRLINRFESGIERLDFPFDLSFAARVTETLANYRRSRGLQA